VAGFYEKGEKSSPEIYRKVRGRLVASNRRGVTRPLLREKSGEETRKSHLISADRFLTCREKRTLMNDEGGTMNGEEANGLNREGVRNGKEKKGASCLTWGGHGQRLKLGKKTCQGRGHLPGQRTVSAESRKKKETCVGSACRDRVNSFLSTERTSLKEEILL